MVPRHDTVAIAGTDGFAKAKTTFSARKIPPVGNAATLLDSEGQVAAGAIFFVDGAGTVRRMDSTGSVTIVAKFPINSAQQSISFAVSPDGKQVIAAVLTYPVNTPQSDPNQPPWGTFSGPWRLQVERATAGGSTVVLHQWQTNTDQYPNGPGGFTNMWMVAWDSQGPIALLGQNTGTQNAWFTNQHYFSGHLVRLNADGTAGASIGPTDCLPYWRPANRYFVCARINTNGPTPIFVVDLTGRTIWSGSIPLPPQAMPPGDFAPAPDGSKLAMDGQVVNLQNGSVIKLATDFQPQGWLDAGTLIGWIPQAHAAPHVAVLRLANPLHPEDWGFSGFFVGLLS
jgi:hypothetical protein